MTEHDIYERVQRQLATRERQIEGLIVQVSGLLVRLQAAQAENEAREEHLLGVVKERDALRAELAEFTDRLNFVMACGHLARFEIGTPDDQANDCWLCRLERMRDERDALRAEVEQWRGTAQALAVICESQNRAIAGQAGQP